MSSTQSNLQPSKSHEKKSPRVVLITGGSRGIGLAMVQRFKEAGWITVTCSTKRELPSDHPADFYFQCDVSQADQVRNGILKVIKNYSQIDVLINNAGLAGGNPLDPNSSDDLWHQIMETNLNGTYYFCKGVSPYLPNETGRIINISSVLGLKGVPDQTAYCAAKHGVIGLTRALAHHFAPRKITVNAICPGWVRTEMAAGRMKELGLQEADFKTSVPLGRFIEPFEIADYAFQIATSPSSSMITGQALTIDGGALL